MSLFTKITVFAKYGLKLCGFWSIVCLLEIYRVVFARAMYSSAFHTALFDAARGGLIHGTDFTSDCTACALPPKHHSAWTCMDAWSLFWSGGLLDVRNKLFFFDAQRILFRCVDRLSASCLFPFLPFRRSVFFTHSKNAFTVEFWQSVSFLLCFRSCLYVIWNCRLACSMVFNVQRSLHDADTLFLLASLSVSRPDCICSGSLFSGSSDSFDRKH